MNQMSYGAPTAFSTHAAHNLPHGASHQLHGAHNPSPSPEIRIKSTHGTPSATFGCCTEPLSIAAEMAPSLTQSESNVFMHQHTGTRFPPSTQAPRRFHDHPATPAHQFVLRTASIAQYNNTASSLGRGAISRLAPTPTITENACDSECHFFPYYMYSHVVSEHACRVCWFRVS